MNKKIPKLIEEFAATSKALQGLIYTSKTIEKKIQEVEKRLDKFQKYIQQIEPATLDLIDHDPSIGDEPISQLDLIQRTRKAENKRRNKVKIGKPQSNSLILTQSESDQVRAIVQANLKGGRINNTAKVQQLVKNQTGRWIPERSLKRFK